MTSVIQIRRLEQWYDRIKQEATNKYSVIVFMGNNNHSIQKQEIAAAAKAIMKKHREAWDEVQRERGEQVIFTDCNLQTGRNSDLATRRLTKALLCYTDKYAQRDDKPATTGTLSDFSDIYHP